MTAVHAARGTLIIACGALAREIAALARQRLDRRWTFSACPPELHNRPERIVPASPRADCATSAPHYETDLRRLRRLRHGRRLDVLLREEGVERLPGAHCYEFFAGSAVFDELADAEPGTFYLTDFLVRHFERLVTRGLGLDRHPELAPNISATIASSSIWRRIRPPSRRRGARTIAAAHGPGVRIADSPVTAIWAGRPAALLAPAEDKQPWQD